MTRQELWEFELEVGTLPNGPTKYRFQDLIEMAKHGTPEAIREWEDLWAERDDYRDQVDELERDAAAMAKGDA